MGEHYLVNMGGYWLDWMSVAGSKIRFLYKLKLIYMLHALHTPDEDREVEMLCTVAV